MGWGRTLAVIAVVGLATRASTAQASPSSRLVYVRGTGADVCPDEDALRNAVATRLGYDPFFPSAPKTVVAEVARTSGGFHGKVQIVLESGKLRGERDLATKGDDCTEVVKAMALAISIALDDLDEEEKKHPPPEPEPEPEPTPHANLAIAAPEPEPEPEPEPAPPKPAPSRHIDFAASLGPTLSLGSAPSAALGGSVVAAVGYGIVAARASFRGDLPSSDSFAPGGTVSTHVVGGDLQGCVRARVPFACAGAGLASFASATSSIAHPATDSARLVTAIVTVGARAMVGDFVFVEPSLGGALNLTPERVDVDGKRIYALPKLAGTLGFHVGVQFF